MYRIETTKKEITKIPLNTYPGKVMNTFDSVYQLNTTRPLSNNDAMWSGYQLYIPLYPLSNNDSKVSIFMVLWA